MSTVSDGAGLCCNVKSCCWLWMLNSPKPTKQRQKFKLLLHPLILILEENTLQTILIEYTIKKPLKVSNLILTNPLGIYQLFKQKSQIENRWS